MAHTGGLVTRLRHRLASATYICRGRLFVRSRRGFSHLSPLLQIHPPEKFHPDEKVFVYVTPGWWLRSLIAPKKHFDAAVTRRPFGRYGNQTLQLAHGLAIAHRIQAERLLCPGNEILPGFDDRFVDGIQLTTTSASIRRTGFFDLLRSFLSSLAPQAHLVGNFFYTTALENGSVTPEERTVSYDLIKNARGPQLPVAPLPQEHLVIHLRGGDAFGPHAHNEYGQPPLAFYRLVLSEGEWPKVTIVTADDVNPLLPHIINEAKELGIPCSIQSGTVDEDTEFLMSATTLVSSRSTFIPAIAAFSDNAHTIYVFGDDDRFPTHLTVKKIIDTEGTYWNSTCVYNWADEPWQRELMVNYPSENLTISVA